MPVDTEKNPLLASISKKNEMPAIYMERLLLHAYILLTAEIVEPTAQTDLQRLLLVNHLDDVISILYSSL